MSEAEAPRRGAPLWQRILPWGITILCFAYLYTRLDRAAGADRSVSAYLGEVFSSVAWGQWLLLMVAYSVLYLLIDTTILWRVVNWFNARVGWGDLLPVRASTYIISILNEQVGKGAIAVFLNRRDGVPGWQLGSSMLLVMVCELFYLVMWAAIGVSLSWERFSGDLAIFRVIPWIAVVAVLVFASMVAFFRSDRFAGVALRDRPIFHAFRQASVGQYLWVMGVRSVSLLAGVFVYSTAAGLFGVEIPLLDMLGILPVVIFGTLVPGPFRAVAVTLWTALFPEHPGPMAVFGFVQHNFFVLFNAAIGLLFLRRVNRELLESAPAEA